MTKPLATQVVDQITRTAAAAAKVRQAARDTAEAITAQRAADQAATATSAPGGTGE